MDRQRLFSIKTWLAPLAALLGVAAACATNPVTGQKQFSLMSESQEIATGQQMDPEARQQFGVYDDPRLQEYVSRIGMQLARGSERPNLPWHFTVVDVPAVNAFALPGGYIYITRGILAYLDDESQLAGVLGHEIGHVTARHAAEQYTRATTAQVGLALGQIFLPSTRPFGNAASTGLGLLFLKYGRDDELQADKLGARYETQAGWDPAGVAEMLTTLGRMDEMSDRRGVPNFLATHPDPAARVVEVRPVVQQLRTSHGKLATNRPEFLQHIDGLMFGDNPREGIVRGNAFLHPDLRFALEFPQGWNVSNSSQQVTAQDPGQRALFLLQLVPGARGGSLEAIAQQSMGGLREVGGQRARINGLDAFVGTYEGQLQDLGAVAVRAAHIVYDGRVYLLAGLTSPESFPQAVPTFDTTIRSFRRLSAGEAEDVHPNRVALYTVRGGETWQSIANGPGRGVVKPTVLATMNDATPSEAPRPGDRIKIVVPGA